MQIMPMKNPVHPGELIADALEDLGLSVAEAAKGLGVSRQQLHNIVAGRSAVSAEMAYRLEKALGSTAQTWLSMQVNYDLARIMAKTEAIKVSVLRRGARRRAA
jgi:addiction module HigA family antidote